MARHERDDASASRGAMQPGWYGSLDDLGFQTEVSRSFASASYDAMLSADAKRQPPSLKTVSGFEQAGCQDDRKGLWQVRACAVVLMCWARWSR